MILATARPDFAHDVGSDLVTTVPLTRLGRQGTDDLVREILKTRAVSGQLLDIVACRGFEANRGHQFDKDRHPFVATICLHARDVVETYLSRATPFPDSGKDNIP